MVYFFPDELRYSLTRACVEIEAGLINRRPSTIGLPYVQCIFGQFKILVHLKLELFLNSLNDIDDKGSLDPELMLNCIVIFVFT